MFNPLRGVVLATVCGSITPNIGGSITAVSDRPRSGSAAAQRQRRFLGISAKDAALARRVVRTEGYEDWAEKFLSSAAPREKWR